VRGEAVDARSDLWSAGLVLYELATGTRAYREERSAQVIYAILNQAPAAPRSLNGRVSAGLEAIILKCLEREPRKRYQGAGELAADLTRLLGGLTVQAERTRVQARRVRTLAIAAPVALVVVIAVLTALNVGGLRTRLFAPPPIRSIAVLPLANLSGDPNQEYFADGMTEALINDLGQVSALRVISRTSAMAYKGAKKPLKQIARELHVDAIVEGSVTRSGDRVKISAQLVNARKDRQMWAQSYERELRDVLVMQSEITRAIVTEVRAKLTAEQTTRLANASQVNPEAYQLCLKGRQLMTVATQDALRGAIEAYQQAIAIDPGAAYAYAGLANAYNIASIVGLAPAGDLMPKARTAATYALGLDDRLAEAHVALSNEFQYEWNWAGADRESDRALELNQNSTDGIASRGVFLYCMGRYEEAAAQFRRLRLASPASYWDLLQAGWGLVYSRRFDEAIATFDQARQLDPNHPGTWMERGVALSMAGRHREAVEECREAVRRAPDVDYLLACCGSVFARAGEHRAAADALERLRAITRRQYVDPYNFAWFYSGAGPNDSALFWLERAVGEHSAQAYSMRAEFWLPSLRADPRFKALPKRMGLPPN
jgi:TolB-like protein/Tfp pilus assembly protein PilF